MKFFLLVLFLFLLCSFASGGDEIFGYIEFSVDDVPDMDVRSGRLLVSEVELYKLNQSGDRIIDSKMLLKFEDQNIKVETGVYELKVFTEDRIFTRRVNVTEASRESVIRAMYANTQQKDIEADIPWAVEPGENFPLLLMVHDADLNDYDVYDIKTYDDNVLIQDSSDDILVDTLDLNGDSCLLAGGFETIDDKLWYRIRSLNPNNFRVDSQGFLHLRIYFNQAWLCDSLDWDVEVFKKIKVLNNDLPKIDNWYCGDTHYHSSYTDTWWGILEYAGYGEVGGPIEMAVESLDSIGLDWVIVTDHSNSFGDNPGFWDDFYDECSSYDECLVGEEVNSDPEVLGNILTCESLPGNHILAYGITEGYVDNGCNGVRESSEILMSINNQGGFAYIAHPESKDDAVFGWDSIITNFREYNLDSYTGLQIWNGDILENETVADLEAGTEAWKDVLLGRDGLVDRMVYVSAGSDAHGDFQDFGREYTCCYAENYSKDNVFDALENGNCYMGNDGAFVFEIDNLYGDVVGMGEEVNVLRNGDFYFNLTVFPGGECDLYFVEGVIGEDDELRKGVDDTGPDLGYPLTGGFYLFELEHFNFGFDVSVDSRRYYRFECLREGGEKRIYTNPIWVNPIECFVDADCGVGFLNSSCEGGDFCEVGVSYSCVNPGEGDAYCREDVIENCEDCRFGCDDVGEFCEEGGLCYVGLPNDGDVFAGNYVPFEIFGEKDLDLIEYIDNSASSPRWRRLCRDCDEYVGSKWFGDGEHDVLVRCSDSVDSEVYGAGFFVDSWEPVILGVEPNGGYSNGSFAVRFREENPVGVFLYYNGFVEEVDDCVEGRRNWKCDVSVDLPEGEAEYWFVVEDIAGRRVESVRTEVIVDSIAPIVNNPDSFWELGEGWWSRYVYFDISITEENFDEVVVRYNSWGRTREKRICNQLDGGVCEGKFRYRERYGDIEVVVRDEAGNQIGLEVLV